MRRYNRMIIAVMAAAVLSACSAKSDAPATEKVGENTELVTQPETRKPDIQIQEETTSAPRETTAPETTAQETASAADAGNTLPKAAEKMAETRAVRETEPARVYAVEAFEKTMYATASVNVRVSYTTRSDVLTSLRPGQKVNVTGRSANGWMRIIYDGRDAYVYQKYLDDNAPKSGTEAAKTENGTPAVITYPGSIADDPTTSPGELPVIEPIPVMTSPGQNATQGNSVTEYGPGMISPGAGNSWTEPATPGYGPGMN